MPKLSGFTQFCNYQEQRIAQSNLSDEEKRRLRMKVLLDAVSIFEKY